MSIEVSCDCAMTYRLPERYAGKRCRCRECGDSIRVPAVRAVAVEAPRTKKLRKPLRARSERTRPVSESLHQMAPLNLSESRVIEPPAARKLIKKAAQKKAAEAAAKARARSRVPAKGPESESELEQARPSRPAHEDRDERDRAGKKKGKKARLGRDANDERPAKKKSKKAKKKAKLETKKAKKPEKKSKKGREREEEDGAEAAETEKKLSPREAKRKAQMRLLLGSLAGLAFCVGFLVFVILRGQHAEEHAIKHLADAKAKVQKAQERARAQDWRAADTLYRETIAFVRNPDDPIHDEKFMADFRRFEAEHAVFPKILAALSKLEADPASAVEDLAVLTGYENDTIRLAGLEGLVKANDGRSVQILRQFANSANTAERDAARRGLIQLGCAEAMPFLAPVILEHGSATPLGQAAIAKALEGAAPDTKALQAVCQKVTDAPTLVRALKLLGPLGDPASIPAVQALTKSGDAEVAKAAEDALAQIKGEKL